MFPDHVTSRFPSVGVTKIKQVLAYKCKESASSFRVHDVRSYGSLWVLHQYWPSALRTVFKYTIINTATLYTLIAVQPSLDICTLYQETYFRIHGHTNPYEYCNTVSATHFIVGNTFCLLSTSICARALIYWFFGVFSYPTCLIIAAASPQLLLTL